MNKRLELHEILCRIINITEPNGDRHIYFSPPASVKMKYPAIVYSLSDINSIHADNTVYGLRNCYNLIYIDKDPDNENVKKIASLPNCRFDRFYTSENLNHYSFTLYF